MKLKARPLQLLRTRQRVAWGDTNYLQYKFYFTLSFNCLNDLIELNCHSFVRKFKVCVFIDCFHWDLDNIRSFFSEFFSVSAAVVKRTAAKRFPALNRILWNFPCMPLQHDLHGLTLTRRVIRNWKMAPMDGGHVITKRKKWCWLFL